MSKPAYPRPYSEILSDDGGKLQQFVDEKGMSLLEYYAGQAMTGMLMSDTNLESLDRIAIRKGDETEKAVSVICFKIAEAMVKEAEKRSQ